MLCSSQKQAMPAQNGICLLFLLNTRSIIIIVSAAARALANRANAQASTGPRSQEAKESVRFNAVAHGLTSKTVVLPHESVEEYQQILQGFVASYNPANEHEKV